MTVRRTVARLGGDVPDDALRAIVGVPFLLGEVEPMNRISWDRAADVPLSRATHMFTKLALEGDEITADVTPVRSTLGLQVEPFLEMLAFRPRAITDRESGRVFVSAIDAYLPME